MLDNKVIECKCGVFGYRQPRHRNKFCSVCGMKVEMRDAKALGVVLWMEEGAECAAITFDELNKRLEDERKKTKT